MSAEFEFQCFFCERPMTKPGGILLGPPAPTQVEHVTQVTKIHICIRCYPHLISAETRERILAKLKR